MNDSAAFQFVRQLGVDLGSGEFELPPFPDTPLRVQRTVNDDNATLDDLAPIVASEPALAARLMRMANSAMMRRGPMEVTDIATAIGRLGMEMVLNAAVVYAAREAFKAPPGSPCVEDLNNLRRHSARVAALSYAIARNTGYRGKPDEAMLAGLLHAVGKFYIFMKAADHPELFADRSGLEALMQQWHTGVARAIVESWGFPENIARAVDEQELRERDRIASADASDVLFVANVLARTGIAAAGELGDLDALARLRCKTEDLTAILNEKAEEIDSMTEALGGG
jgi:HD-like signal output (HDOD) protein